MTRGRHRGVCPLASRQPRTAVAVEERRESILAAKGTACGSRGFLAGEWRKGRATGPSNSVTTGWVQEAQRSWPFQTGRERCYVIRI